MNSNKTYEVKITELLLKLTKLKTAIILKRKYLYENEIIELKNEFNISYENARDIVQTVYSEIFNNVYKYLFDIIESISNDILNKNYESNDFYILSNKEYQAIYRSNI